MNFKELNGKEGKYNMKVNLKFTKNKKIYTNQKGITLIALVVTIVVLLILAGVTINAVFSDSGIIKKAQESQNKMNEARNSDLEAINSLSNEIDNIIGTPIPVTGIKILYNGVDSENTTVMEGTLYLELSAVIEPENATNKKVIWSCSDESATVTTVNENTVKISKNVRGGDTLVITAMTEDGNKTDTFEVYVNNCCFVAGTQVLSDLEGNTKNIEDYRKGDTVVSYNVKTGEKYLAKVNSLIINPKATNMAKVYLEDGTILDMTDYHPLYTKKGFKSLTNYMGFETLTEQDYVKTKEGYAKISKIERYTTDPIVTYNLDIIDFDEEIDNDENDNFYANGIVVHNAPCLSRT